MSDWIERQVAIDAVRKCQVVEVTPAYMLIDKAEVMTDLMLLPSAQSEPCEDAISRQRLLNDLKELIVVWGKYPVMAEPIKGIGTAIGYVAAIPSVTPKRKMGKWILLEECANAGYYCSECRKRVVREGWSGTVRKIKFCPNCGADMRSEAEQEVK